jgi:hypothetical protein
MKLLCLAVGVLIIGCARNESYEAMVCGGVHDQRGRVWIPGNSGCGPTLTQIDRIVLYDGRECEYVYDRVEWPRTLRGLWCEQGK